MWKSVDGTALTLAMTMEMKFPGVVDWDVVELNKDYVLSPNEVWGIVELGVKLVATRRSWKVL